MGDNIQTNTTGQLMPCLQKKIDKTTYLVEVHFSDTSTQNAAVHNAAKDAAQVPAFPRGSLRICFLSNKLPIPVKIDFHAEA